MADRVEKKGAESSAIPEHMYWAEVEAPMLFGLTDAHREEIELITLSDLHAGCAYRLSTLASVRGQIVGSFAPLYTAVTENQDQIRGLKVALRSYSQICEFIDYNKGKMFVSTPDHADIHSMQVKYTIQRCNAPSPFEQTLFQDDSKRATVTIRSMYFRSGGC